MSVIQPMLIELYLMIKKKGQEQFPASFASSHSKMVPFCADEIDEF